MDSEEFVVISEGLSSSSELDISLPLPDTMPSLSTFTLPDPCDVPPVLDSHQTETSDQRLVIQTEEEPTGLLQGPEREAETFGLFKNCEICNVVLNSASQAEMHYAGKTHQKKLRHLADMKDSVTPETSSSGLTSTSPPCGTAKGLTMPHCDICGLTFTAMSQAKMHLGGQRHAKKLLQLAKKTAEEVANPADAAKSVKQETEAFVCNYCKTICTSKSQLEQHCQGSKHKSVVAAASNIEENRLVIPPSSSNSAVASFLCADCNVSTNSEMQYLQHMGSHKHKSKLLHRGRDGARHQPYPIKRETIHIKKLSSYGGDFNHSNTSKAPRGQATWRGSLNQTESLKNYGATYRGNLMNQGGSFMRSDRGNSLSGGRSFMGSGRGNSLNRGRSYMGSGRGNSLSRGRSFLESDQDNSFNQGGSFESNRPSSSKPFTQADSFSNYEPSEGPYDSGNHGSFNPALFHPETPSNQDESFSETATTSYTSKDSNGGSHDGSNMDDSWGDSSGNHTSLAVGRGSGWQENWTTEPR